MVVSTSIDKGAGIVYSDVDETACEIGVSSIGRWGVVKENERKENVSMETVQPTTVQRMASMFELRLITQ